MARVMCCKCWSYVPIETKDGRGGRTAHLRLKHRIQPYNGVVTEHFMHPWEAGLDRLEDRPEACPVCGFTNVRNGKSVSCCRCKRVVAFRDAGNWWVMPAAQEAVV